MFPASDSFCCAAKLCRVCDIQSTWQQPIYQWERLTEIIILGTGKLSRRSNAAMMTARGNRAAGVRLFAGLQQRADPPRALEQLQERDDGGREIERVERERRDHEIGAEHVLR